MIKLPEEIEWQMKAYRAGIAPIPFLYTDFHYIVAHEDAEKQDWKVLEDHGLQDDGWCDGAKFVRLEVAYKQNGKWEFATVQWHPDGAWFKKSAGWTRFREMISDV